MANLIENDALFVDSDTPAQRFQKQVDRADTKYRSGATGMAVQTDQTAREAKANAAHTALANSALGASLNHANNAQGVPSYTGGNRVTVAANRAGIDLFPEDTSAVEDLEQEVQVAIALDAGTLFAKGGQVPPTNYTGAGSLSSKADPMFLAEASKQTGEKLF